MFSIRPQMNASRSAIRTAKADLSGFLQRNGRALDRIACLWLFDIVNLRAVRSLQHAQTILGHAHIVRIQFNQQGITA